MAEENSREPLLLTVEGRSVLDDRFTDIKRLRSDGGSGTFSLVFSAYDLAQEKRIALKFFNPQKLSDTYRWECFQREASILGELKGQPNILQHVAPIKEFSEPFESALGVKLDVKFAYYAVELAETDVADLIDRSGWSARDKLLVFQEMCKAVQRLHSHFYVHRDLKPSNFLLMSDGALKLSDFGTARKIDNVDGGLLTRYPFPPGELLYTAPELLACLHDVDPLFARGADFYSLGSILFEMFSRVPLGYYVLSRINVDRLMQGMGSIPKERRILEYLASVTTLATAMALPSIDATPGEVPPSIMQPLDRLYKSLAAIDYQSRLTNFDRVFRLISQCVLILDNEDKLRQWRERKEQFQLLAARKRERIAAIHVGNEE